MNKITESKESDYENVAIIEKYIMAGIIAQDRVGKELDERKRAYEETGALIDSQSYNDLKKGSDLFNISLANLERSRVMYILSLEQLELTQDSNVNVQTTIHTQKSHSMALLSQQLRNAVLNAKNAEVMRGQKAINRLNDELIRKVSSDVVDVAKESGEMLYSGFYSVESAKQAISTVIEGCEQIQRTAEEMLPRMNAEVTELNKLADVLQPHIDKIKEMKGIDSGASTANTTRKTISSSSELKF